MRCAVRRWLLPILFFISNYSLDHVLHCCVVVVLLSADKFCFVFILWLGWLAWMRGQT